MTMRYWIQLGLIALLAMQLAGCSTIRDWMRGERSSGSHPVPIVVPTADSGVWVPLLPTSAPIRPAPYNGAGGQLEGLVTVIQEVDAVNSTGRYRLEKAGRAYRVEGEFSTNPGGSGNRQGRTGWKQSCNRELHLASGLS